MKPENCPTWLVVVLLVTIISLLILVGWLIGGEYLKELQS